MVEGNAKIDPTEKANAGLKILTQQRLTSRTEGDHIISFDGTASLVGSVVAVRVTEATSLSLSGELV